MELGESPIPIFQILGDEKVDLDRLLATGSQCIHSEPPRCNSYCPLHIDVIGMMTEIEQGSFEKAYKIMEKRMPFPRLIGKICDHPCESYCVREDFGGHIHISELESITIQQGYTPPKRVIPMPKNKGKIAVIGGGLSSITVALDLDKKGYAVHLFEKSERLGGSVWNFVPTTLSDNEVMEELNELAKKIQISYKTEINNIDLKTMIEAESFKAIYLGTGQWSTPFAIDQVTFQTKEPSVFAGGTLAHQKDSVIESVSSGRRAAISIDRYISGVSLTASREREGIFETPLAFATYDVIAEVSLLGHANISQDVAQEETQEETQEESQEEHRDETKEIFKEMSKEVLIERAIAEAKRCLKCQCVECIKTCIHMQSFDIAPDAYIRQINQNERIILGTHYANKMINSCTECGLCKEKCPVGISMKDVILETRQSMVEKKKMPQSAHDFALKDMEFSHSDQFSLVRRQPSKEASKHLFYYPVLSYSKYARGLYKGTGKTGFVFYPGCQLSASHSDRISDLYQYLVGTLKEAHQEGDVGLYLGCCGAPAQWAGRQDLMNESIHKIKAVWEEMEQPIFILACSSCISIFEKYLPEITTLSLWEIFDQYGLPERNIIPGRRVISIHDACTTRYHAKIHQSIRRIVIQLGYTIEELDSTMEETKCCGYGGLVYYANKQHAQEFVKDRMKDSQEDLLVYCAMCKDLFVEGGKRTFHILDLIYAKDLESAALKKMPTFSERHVNRKQLKAALLRDIWGETPMTDEEKTLDRRVIFSDELLKIMEKRYILTEDIMKVLYHAKENEDYFYNPETSEYLAKLRIVNVTYWVMYKEDEEELIITNVYSHRMEVVEEVK